METYIDGSEVAVCLTSVETFWPAFFFIFSITIFFFLPLLILIVLYSVIAKHLMENPGIISQGHRNNVLKYRKQVIFMLGAVVLSFFLCLLPFRALTLWIIVVPPETIVEVGLEGYYNLLYFSRIMHYLNSAMNPILYNLMSSKFREGFLRLLGCKSMVRHKLTAGTRKGTFHTTSTNLSSSSSDKRRELRRTSMTNNRKSVDESTSSASEPNGSGTQNQHPRKLSFEEASGSIVKCARAILIQNNVIEELDETTSPEQPTQQSCTGIDTEEVAYHQEKHTIRNNSYNNDNVLLHSSNSCSSHNKKRNNVEDTKTSERAIIAPLLEKTGKIDYKDKTMETIKTRKSEMSDIIREDEETEETVVEENIVRILEATDMENGTFLEIDLENLRTAKESLV